MNVLPTTVSRCIRVALLGCLPVLAGCDAFIDEDSDPTLLNTAREMESQKRFPAAVDAYRRYIQGEGGNTHHTYSMIRVAVLEETIRHGEDPLLDLYLMAVDQRDEGNWPDALITLDDLLAQGPDNRLADDALYLKGYIHLVDSQQYNVAYELMAELRTRYPSSTYANTALYSQGLAQKHLGNLDLAKQHFTELRNLHTGLTVDIFNIRWPQDNYISRLWFTRAHEQLLSLTEESRIGIAPSTNEMQLRDMDERANVILVFTDDQGYADLGANGVVSDIQTPNLDNLAADGVRMTAGYVTAPQCTPSRAGLMTGKYQQRFGLDDNRYTPMPLSEQTIANRLQNAGYRTGMVGKWHLEVDQNSREFDVNSMPLEQRTPWFPNERGFEDVYYGYMNRWWTNYNLAGDTLPPDYRDNTDYRLDVATDAGLAFIERHKQEPFFLYLSYFAPHVPMEATEKYLSRHEGVAETRRQYALAMMSAIDDGIGRIRENLAVNGLTDNTIIFFISDNGAPVGIHRLDPPIEDHGGIWDGSLNDPWVGEKGMLAEGGIRVPYVVSWPGTLPAGVVYNDPVSTLDVATTSLAAAGEEIPDELDGADLTPRLRGERDDLKDRALYWRFWSQSAIRKGQWKYLAAGDREFLFDMNNNHEQDNQIRRYPNIASQLRGELDGWSQDLYRPGLRVDELNNQEKGWYNHYFR